MRFCPNCDNILIPRNKKLFCKACEEEFALDSKNQNDYKIIKKIRHQEIDIAPIVIKSGATTRITAQDRKAHEEFFGSGEESGY